MCQSKKQVLEADILCNEPIADGIYRLKLGGANVACAFKEAEAGQFINVYLRDAAMLLPRPISLCRIQQDSITFVYRLEGAGTKQLATYQSGTQLKITGPLGSGYRLETSYKGKTAVVAGGGIGIPPMLQLAEELKRRGAEVIAVLGYRDGAFLDQEAAEFCSKVYRSSDNGCQGMIQGTILDLLLKEGISGDFYFACGPKAMLRALADYCNEKEAPLQVSLEERMGCGFGACVGCACNVKAEINGKTEVVKKAVCKDGPVFLASEVVWE